MVIFEAARAICNLKDVTTRELTPAVTLLQLFLSSNKPVVRFAAVRTLNKVSPAPIGPSDHHKDQTVLASLNSNPRPCVSELWPPPTLVRAQAVTPPRSPRFAWPCAGQRQVQMGRCS